MGETIGRSLQLLEYVASAKTPPSHSELRAHFDIPKSTLSGILGELRELGYIVARENRTYAPGPKFLSLTFVATRAAVATREVRPILEFVSEETRQTALFAVLVGDSAIYIDKVDSPELIRYVPELGSRRPLHATAVGKVLLAFADTVNIEVDLERFTESTITDSEKFAEEIRLTRRQGYALNDGESQAGISAIAIPVRTQEGVLQGAISAAGPVKPSQDLTVFLPSFSRALVKQGFLPISPESDQ